MLRHSRPLSVPPARALLPRERFHVYWPIFQLVVAVADVVAFAVAVAVAVAVVAVLLLLLTLLMFCRQNFGLLRFDTSALGSGRRDDVIA